MMPARAGSAHGCDVVDPTEVSPELGGDDGLRQLVAALRAHGMGLVADIVPNHMAASHENPWWVETLRHGPASQFARVFDVDWEAGGGRVRLPVLAGPPDRVGGDLRVEGGWARYHQHRFPLAPGTDRLDQQHYELVEWRRAAVDGNYRRFFTVNDLSGVCQQDPEVFRLTHQTTLRLVADGLVDGVLVDPAAAGTFTERYRRITGSDPDPAELAVAGKRERLPRSSSWPPSSRSTAPTWPAG